MRQNSQTSHKLSDISDHLIREVFKSTYCVIAGVKNWGSNKFDIQKYLGFKNIVVQRNVSPKKFWVKKTVWSRKILGPKKFGSQKNFRSKKFRIQKDVGFEKILGPKKF